MGVVLAEHRLERCLAAADRVLAVEAARVVFDGAPADFCDWVAGSAPELAPPGVRLFSLAGVRPLPVAAKHARRILSEHRLTPLPTAIDTAAVANDAPLRRRGAPEPALAARELWVELDSGAGLRDVVRRLELDVRPRERLALMGRNGAGKSTFLRTAAGLLKPARGSIATPSGCVLLPQSPGDLLIRERVDEELPGEAGARALAAVGLEWAAAGDPRDLSGGERERLALAIVMAGREGAAGRPGLICLDEPTRGMDGRRKQELVDWLTELTEAGSAVIVATHDVEFAARFATRVVLMGDGEAIADGPADEILSGGWYFATEVARILGGGGAITPEAGARVLERALAAAAAIEASPE